jgi:hypothetical protein
MPAARKALLGGQFVRWNNFNLDGGLFSPGAPSPGGRRAASGVGGGWTMRVRVDNYYIRWGQPFKWNLRGVARLLFC